MSLVIRAPAHIRVSEAQPYKDWHDAEWQVAIGCTRVSPGCQNCTAENSLIHTPVSRLLPDNTARWTGIVKEQMRQVTLAPKRWDRPMKIFVGSTTDFWHDQISDALRDRVWEICNQRRSYVFGFLTKRPDRMRAWFARTGHTTPDNVWLGTSVESQDYVGRLDDLLAVDARVRFAQCEPLLGPINLRPYLRPSRINWVVAGPEWGCDHPRPCDSAWMRSLRDDAAIQGVPFFTKHILDGREHRNYPNVPGIPGVP